MLRDFIAIDFETANQQPSSVCSIGVVMVRDGQVVDSFYSLIQPEPNYYNYWCQRVHGISESDTDDAPVFSKVWQQLEERIADVFFPDQELDDMRYQIASTPSFMLCNPNGIPTIVIIRISPAMKYSMAICKPPNNIHMMFPNVFILVSLSILYLLDVLQVEIVACPLL